MTATKSPTHTTTFGPGRLEDIEVKVWTARGSGGRRRKALVSGTFRVYAPSGEYLVDISEAFSAWESEAEHGAHEEAVLVWGAYTHEASAEELADLAVEYALEDWHDPYPEDFEDEAAA